MTKLFDLIVDQIKLVRRLVKNPLKIINETTPEKMDLMHMALGVAGEAGEIVDCIKKHTIYNQPLNITNLKEEIGDMMFYITRILDTTEITLEECLEANQSKLNIRFSEATYTDRAAKERADKLGHNNDER